MIKNKNYIDFKVTNVMNIKDSFGFRVKLKLDNGEERVIQKSAFKTKKAANEERNRIVAELTTGSYVIEDKLLVKTFLLDWIENEFKPKVRDNSYKTYKKTIVNHINPKIGNVELKNLNKGHLQKFYDELRKKYTSTYKIAVNVMSASMKYALNKKLISINPTIGIRKPKHEANSDHRIVNIDTAKTLTEEQLNILLKAGKDSKIYMELLFSGLMGLRISETHGLKYSDVDFVNRKLKVSRQLGVIPCSTKQNVARKTYSKQEIPLKTESSYRELDIPDIVFNAILEKRKYYEERKKRRQNDRNNPFQDLDYICCSSYGRPRSRGYCVTHFKKLLKENNLPNIRWHDLRSTFATILMKKDFSLKAISKKLGHKKQIITADVYGDKRAIIIDCLDNLNPFIESVKPEKQKNRKEQKIENDYTIDKSIIKVMKFFDSLVADSRRITKIG